MPHRSPAAAAPAAPTQVRQAAARCRDRDAHMNPCRFPVVKFGSVSPRWRSGNSAHGQKDAGLAFTRQRPPPPWPGRRRMFMIVGRAAGGQQLQPHEATPDTTRHNNGFSGMPCDARLRGARPVGVSRWHARGQGFKSPQLHQAQRIFSLRSERHLPEIARKRWPWRGSRRPRPRAVPPRTCVRRRGRGAPAAAAAGAAGFRRGPPGTVVWSGPWNLLRPLEGPRAYP
jgi:hypothetical protein